MLYDKSIIPLDTDKIIAGVCGGLAAYFDIDPALVRVGFLVLVALGGLPGLAAYFFLWVAAPDEPAA